VYAGRPSGKSALQGITGKCCAIETAGWKLQGSTIWGPRMEVRGHLRSGFICQKRVCLQLLGSLMKGDGENSFLTPTSISTVLGTWHALTRSQPESEMPAMVGGLDCCFFTAPVWRQHPGAVAVDQLLDLLGFLYSAARLSQEVGLLILISILTCSRRVASLDVR